MSPTTHAYNHFTRGSQFLSGYGLGDFVVDGNGNSDSNAQFSVEGGMMTDEDLPTMSSSITSTTGIPVYYLSGSGAYLRRNFTSGFSVMNDAISGRLYFNENVGGVWQLSTVTNGNYVLYHIFGINGYDGKDKVIAIMGQNQYSSSTDAREGATLEINDIVTGIAIQEIIPIGTIIYQTRDNYTNSVKARIISTEEGGDYVDWRTTELSQGSNPSNHDNLLNVRSVGIGVSKGHLSDIAETIYGVKTFNDGLIIPTITDTFDIETKVLDITDYTTYDNVKYTFFISDGTNMRNGTLYILCNGTTSYLSESSGASVGNTDAVTFDADLSVNNIQLKVISTTTGWTIKLKKEMQW